MPEQEQSAVIFTKSFIAISAINFLIMLSYYLLFVIMGPYAQSHFNASSSLSGLIASLMVIGCLIGRFMVGGIIDKFGHKRLLCFGLVLTAMSMGLYFVSDTLPVLVATRILSGICVGCVTTATGTMIAHIIPAKQRGLGISYFSMSSVLAMAIGPFLGIALHVSYPTFFWMCIAFSTVALLCALPVSSTQQTHAAHNQTRGSFLQRYIESRAIPIAFMALIAGIGYGCVQAFIASYARELNLITAASIYFPLYAAVAFLIRPLAGRTFDMRGESHVIYPALICLILSLFLLSQTQGSITMLLSGAMLGLGFGTFQTSAQAIAVKVAPNGRFGQATSTFYILLDSGIGLGPYLLGLIQPYAGYSGIYFTTSLLALTLPVLYFFLHSRMAHNAASTIGSPQS